MARKALHTFYMAARLLVCMYVWAMIQLRFLLFFNMEWGMLAVSSPLPFSFKIQIQLQIHLHFLSFSFTQRKGFQPFFHPIRSPSPTLCAALPSRQLLKSAVKNVRFPSQEWSIAIVHLAEVKATQNPPSHWENRICKKASYRLREFPWRQLFGMCGLV